MNVPQTCWPRFVALDSALPRGNQSLLRQERASMRRTDLHRMHPVRTFAWLAFNLPTLLSLLLLKLELLSEFDSDNILNHRL